MINGPVPGPAQEDIYRVFEEGGQLTLDASLAKVYFGGVYAGIDKLSIACALLFDRDVPAKEISAAMRERGFDVTVEVRFNVKPN